MANALLIAIGLLACYASVVMAVRRNSACWAPAAMALIFMVLALAGGPLWAWSRHSGGSGLPDDIVSLPPLQSAATAPLAWAAVGAALACLLIPRSAPAGPSYGPSYGTPFLPAQRAAVRAEETSRTIGVLVLVATLVTYSLWLVGQGSTILERFEYLRTDGNPFLLRVTYPAGVVLALTALWLASQDRSALIRWTTYAMSFIWFISLSSVGTRTAVAFPLLFAVIMIRKGTSRRRIGAGSLIIGCVAVVAVVVTFGVTQDARDNPHGLLNYWSLLQGVLSGDGVTNTLQKLASSIVASHPLVEKSALSHVDPWVLIANANPLPGTAQPAELERLWPYEWVPLAFVGTWYAAMGVLAQVSLFGFMAYACGITFHNMRLGRFHAASILPVGYSVLLALLSIQYPSRMVLRLVSIIVLLAIISYLVRSSTLVPAVSQQPSANRRGRPLAAAAQ